MGCYKSTKFCLVWKLKPTKKKWDCALSIARGRNPSLIGGIDSHTAGNSESFPCHEVIRYIARLHVLACDTMSQSQLGVYTKNYEGSYLCQNRTKTTSLQHFRFLHIYGQHELFVSQDPLKSWQKMNISACAYPDGYTVNLKADPIFERIWFALPCFFYEYPT